MFNHYDYYCPRAVNGVLFSAPFKKLPTNTWSIEGLKSLLLPTGLDIADIVHEHSEDKSAPSFRGKARFQEQDVTVVSYSHLRRFSLLRVGYFTATFTVLDPLGFTPSLQVELGFTLEPPTHFSPLSTMASPFNATPFHRPRA